MTNPFAHDIESNAARDYSFSEDQGVPSKHVASFAAAMDAPSSNLGEADYRFPAGRQFSDRPGQYPRGYAP
jgi:hypothetical protein